MNSLGTGSSQDGAGTRSYSRLPAWCSYAIWLTHTDDAQTASADMGLRGINLHLSRSQWSHRWASRQAAAAAAAIPFLAAASLSVSQSVKQRGSRVGHRAKEQVPPPRPRPRVLPSRSARASRSSSLPIRRRRLTSLFNILWSRTLGISVKCKQKHVFCSEFDSVQRLYRYRWTLQVISALTVRWLCLHICRYFADFCHPMVVCLLSGLPGNSISLEFGTWGKPETWVGDWNSPTLESRDNYFLNRISAVSLGHIECVQLWLRSGK